MRAFATIMALRENDVYFLEYYYQNEQVTVLDEVVQGM